MSLLRIGPSASRSKNTGKCSVPSNTPSVSQRGVDKPSQIQVCSLVPAYLFSPLLSRRTTSSASLPVTRAGVSATTYKIVHLLGFHLTITEASKSAAFTAVHLFLILTLGFVGLGSGQRLGRLVGIQMFKGCSYFWFWFCLMTLPPPHTEPEEGQLY